jgi:hypothetical protein
MTMPTKSAKPTTTNAILADRIQVDLIERLERVLDLLDEELNVSGYFQTSAHNALREAIEHLVELREERAR